MFVKQLFTNKTVGTIFIITLACQYVLSILACTIGLFTPYWLHGVERYHGSFFVYDTSISQFATRNYADECQTVGLVSGQCRFPYSTSFDSPENIVIRYLISNAGHVDNRHELARNMERTLYCVLATICVLYTNLAMTLVAFIFNLFDNKIYMGFLSLHYGVIYPLGAISVLIASIMLEVEYKSEVGYSTILGTISGGLMLVFYATLSFYNDQYMRYRLERLGDDDTKYGSNNKKEHILTYKNQMYKID